MCPPPEQQPPTQAQAKKSQTTSLSDEDMIYGAAPGASMSDEQMIYGSEKLGDTRTQAAEEVMGPLSDEEKAGIKKTEAMFGPKGPDTAGDTFMKQALRVPVNMVQGAAQLGMATLKSIGIGVTPQAYQSYLHYRETERGAFEKAAAKGVEENPGSAMMGNIAGELMMFSATGPAFFETKYAEAALKAAPLVSKMIAGAAQGTVLSGSEAMGDSDHPGVKAFMGALGGAFGAAGAHALGTAAAKASNAFGIRLFHKEISEGAQGWTEDSQTLSRIFQGKLADVRMRTAALKDAAQKAVEKDLATKFKAGKIINPFNLDDDPIPSGLAKSTQDAVQKYRRYSQDTEFFNAKEFRTVRRAGPTLSSGTDWIESNRSLIKLASGDNKIQAERLYKSMNPAGRALIQKGILYDALEKATNVDTGKYQASKLKDALDSPGVRVFFQGKDAEMLDGLDSIVHSSEDLVGRHPWLIARGAHDVSNKLIGSMFGSSLGSGAGYLMGGKKGAVEGAAAGAMGGFIGYIAVLKAVNSLMRSQSGRNLMSAAGTIEKGTPKGGKIINDIAGAIWTPFDVAADPFSGSLFGP